ELVAGSFLEAAPVVPVSVRTGVGLDDLRTALTRVSEHAAARTADSVVRLPIDRVFSMKGFGTVVTGTLVSGRLAIEHELTILPGSRVAKIRGVQVHGQRRGEATAGQRVAVNLGGVDVQEIERGQNLVTSGAFAESRVADAAIEVLETAK